MFAYVFVSMIQNLVAFLPIFCKASILKSFVVTSLAFRFLESIVHFEVRIILHLCAYTHDNIAYSRAFIYAAKARSGILFISQKYGRQMNASTKRRRNANSSIVQTCMQTAFCHIVLCVRAVVT